MSRLWPLFASVVLFVFWKFPVHHNLWPQVQRSSGHGGHKRPVLRLRVRSLSPLSASGETTKNLFVCCAGRTTKKPIPVQLNLSCTLWVFTLFVNTTVTSHAGSVSKRNTTKVFLERNTTKVKFAQLYILQELQKARKNFTSIFGTMLQSCRATEGAEEYLIQG